MVVLRLCSCLCLCVLWGLKLVLSIVVGVWVVNVYSSFIVVLLICCEYVRLLVGFGSWLISVFLMRFFESNVNFSVVVRGMVRVVLLVLGVLDIRMMCWWVGWLVVKECEGMWVFCGWCELFFGEVL